jgi:protein arginine N-methyltransferase 1
MYSIGAYGQMIADRSRTGAYAAALQRAVTPKSVVLDLGTGTGIFALLACQYGARKVYAVEPGDAIAVAREIACANGFAERIEFIQKDSRDITLPQKADVIVSDMRGTLPLFGTNLSSILDARRRFLADGGRLIPRCDSLWAAVVSVPETYQQLTAPWEECNFGLDMSPAKAAVTNSLKSIVATREQLVSEPKRWASLEYATLEAVNYAATIPFRAARAGIAHGLLLWFDCELAEGIEFSNAPGNPPLVYRSSLLPWPNAVALEEGDAVEIRLRADFTGSEYMWSWESAVQGAAGEKAHFRQSTFFSSPLFSADRLRRRSSAHQPTRGVDVQIDALILSRIDGATPLERIASLLMARFPDRFRSLGEALARVGDLTEQYERRG